MLTGASGNMAGLRRLVNKRIRPVDTRGVPF